MLLGRSAEAARIAELIDGARRGGSAVLVLRGEAGIGKSALLAHAEEQFGAGRVLATRAVEAEAEIPYVHLADLLRPITGSLDELAPRQAAALAGALALGPPTSGDRFAIAAATLSLISGAARTGPVLILVDDVQWLDPFSFEVLAFVGHRLHAEGTVMLMTVRVGEAASDGLQRFEHLELSGLDGEAALALIETTGHRLDRATTTRLVSESGGNPLALLELPALLRNSRPTGWGVGLDPLPIGELVAQAFRHALDRLPDESRDALLLLAILGSVTVDMLTETLAQAGLGISALTAAEDARLVVTQDSKLVFRHPLIRATVYQAAPRARRRWAHVHAADVLLKSASPNALERRAWHLVESGGGPDETIAASLETSAADEYTRANFAVAANLFERSSQIGQPGGPAAGRLLRAADAYRLAGAIEVARQMLVRALDLVDGPLLPLILRYYACRIDLWRGATDAGSDDLVAIARQVESLDPSLAARILCDAALVCAEGGRLAITSELCARAQRLVDADERLLELDIVTALGHALRGQDDDARVLLRARADDVDAIDPIATDLVDQLGLVTAMGHLAIEEVERADQLLVTAVAGARDASAVGVLPFRLGRLAWVRYWQGRWASAVALANEALQLADDTGWISEIPNSLAVLARVAASTGNDGDCRAYAARAMSLARAPHVGVAAGYAHGALGLLALGAGDADSAAQQFALVVEFAASNGLVDTPMLWWSSDLIEALVLLGRHDEAEHTLVELERTLERHPIPSLAAVAARSKALVAPDDFERHVTDALRLHGAAGMPFERARTELALGAHLRRSGDPRALEHLERSRAVFDQLGARPWSEASRTELDTVGGAPSRPAPLFARLTPQELQVALQVARGLTNREVAARLFLSVKTVEFHLGNVFHKLGVKRRAQLAMIVARQDPTVLTPLLAHT